MQQTVFSHGLHRTSGEPLNKQIVGKSGNVIFLTGPIYNTSLLQHCCILLPLLEVHTSNCNNDVHIRELCFIAGLKLCTVPEHVP